MRVWNAHLLSGRFCAAIAAMMSLVVVFGVMACSRPGTTPIEEKQESDPDKRGMPDDRDDRDAQRSTPVSLTRFHVSRIDTKRCPNRMPSVAPVTLSDAPSIDGQMSEWAELEPWIRDPSGDSQSAVDLQSVTLARHGTKMFGAINISAPVSTSYEVELEFGRLLNNDHGELEFAMLRRYLIDESGLRQWDEGSTEFLPPQSARGGAALGEDGAEWFIPLVMLEGVIYQPLWMIRAKIITEGQIVDQSHSHYSPNLLAHDSGFASGSCLASVSDPDSFKFVEVYDSSIEDLELVEHILSLVRVAYNSVQMLLNRPQLPVSGITVVVTNKPSESPPPILDHRLGNRDNLYRELVVDASNYGSESTEAYADAVVFKAAVTRFINLYIDQFAPLAPDYLRRMWLRYFKTHVVRARLGRGYWIDHWRLPLLGFLARPDSLQPLTLVDRYEGLIQTIDDADDEWLTAYQEYFGKAYGLGSILAELVPLDVQLRVLHELRELAPDEESLLDLFLETLKARLPANRQEQIRHLRAGWLEGDVYHEGHSPKLLSDEDQDGLPLYLELSIGSNPNLIDTDNDGWSDYAEFISGTDPVSMTSNPAAITADNFFGDWQVLLPDRVEVDRGTSSSGCPASADLTHFSGIASPDTLVIGAVAKDLWSDPPHVRWEADLEVAVPGQGPLLVTLQAISGRYYYEILDSNTRAPLKRVYRAMPLGVNVIEWIIERQHLGLGEEFSFASRGAVRYRFKTVYERTERIFCDDTPWSLPLISK